LIPFTKTHACGNDFLIVTEEAVVESDWAELTRRLCARNTGVGADGIEFFAWTGLRSGRIRLHNADGSIAEISGNGTRCVAAWMAEARNAEAGDVLEIETDAGLRVCRLNAVRATSEFSVDVTTGMGVPQFTPRPVTIPGGVQVQGVQVSTGNPHFVIIVDNDEFSVDRQRWQSIGQQICAHPDFPYQTHHIVRYWHVGVRHGGHWPAWLHFAVERHRARWISDRGLEGARDRVAIDRACGADCPR
jgi:diaminopimelate epimerase